MGEPSFGRFQHGNLDPQAQEFVPRTTIFSATPQILIPPPPHHQIFYPFPPPQTVPFNTEVTILSYHHHQQQQYPLSPPPYVRALPLPPESSSPTRTLTLTSVPRDLSEALVRQELEVFGQIRGLEMERIYDGIVTVHFYDLRHAEKALNEIRNQHMQHQARLGNIFAHNIGHEHGFVSSHIIAPTTPGLGSFAGCGVWAQFVMPSCTSVPDGQNQGTIVVFNLDPNVSAGLLRKIFQTYGAVKEVRETPMKKQQRFVEFFDVRDAAKALKEMNGKEIRGKEVVIEFSRPGGYGRKFLNGNTSNKSFSYNCSDNAKMYKHGRHLSPSPPPALPRRYSGYFSAENSVSPRAHGRSSEPSSSAKRSPSVEKDSIEVSVSVLSLSGGDNADVLEKDGDVSLKRNAKSTAQSGQANTIVKHQQRLKPWKGKQAKKLDTRFLINEGVMVESNFSTDTRTTVMIKNIPNKYSQKLLLNMLDNHCIHCNEQISDGDDQPLSSYDFVYLPIDFNNKCNVGYGFVNMTSPRATWRLYKAFHHQHWEVFNSRKICEVTYARVQGLDALKEHFKNSKFPSEMDHYLPVVFSPPRDGRQQTEPSPIVCHKPVIFALPSTNEIDKINTKQHHDNNTDREQEEDSEEALMKYCCSNSSSCSQNGGDLCYDDDDDKDRA